jgi:hypothetical protein
MRRVVAIAVVLLAAMPLQAGPRDELLRVAPPDAALVVVVQNAREHVHALAESPFADWFPTTAVGKKFIGSGELKQLREAADNVLPALGTTPAELFKDVLGDAVAFAYSPAPTDRPDDERAVILVRPAKPETLAKIVARVNEIQTKNGEVKEIVRRTHGGAEYFERRKPQGAEFYCFRNGVFAFSSNEADIKDVLTRDEKEPKDAVSPWVTRMRQLAVADASVVLLVNPRPLDAELKIKVQAAAPSDQPLLRRVAQAWAGLEFLAVSVSLDRNLELGLSLRFHPDKLPADLKKWLVGPQDAGTAFSLVPTNALFGVAGHAKAAELIDLVASLVPTSPDKPGIKEWIAQKFGAIVGRNHLPIVLDSLGPNWAVWGEPPEKGAFLPTLVAAVEVTGKGEAKVAVEKALGQAATFAFQTFLFSYNARHTDQIELKTETVAVGTITSLVNEKGFPPGFQPSFALTGGYFVLASSPDAIRRFTPPVAVPGEKGTVTLARLSGTGCRAYLAAHREPLVKFLAGLGVGDEKTLSEHLSGFSDVLELVDSAALSRHDVENGLRLVLTVKPTRSLKK